MKKESYYLVLSDGHRSINLTHADCTSLERKLTATKYGIVWRHMGDTFYSYARKKPNASYVFVVTPHQYEFCQILLSRKDWQDCQDL